MVKTDIDWGKKMIKVSVHFWTNNLPRGSDNKTAWESGAIHMVANKQRGLKHEHVFFNGLQDFFPKLQELLKNQGVKLKMSEKVVDVDFSKLVPKQ